ncbi:MAG: hypothetical protein M1828_006493 [Chrysothrix sp. TS-e1954]|nr:MAG: hypothetical protein M1828_006493 [Chrysothrix sp. TS-e1954]
MGRAAHARDLARLIPDKLKNAIHEAVRQGTREPMKQVQAPMNLRAVRQCKQYYDILCLDRDSNRPAPLVQSVSNAKNSKTEKQRRARHRKTARRAAERAAQALPANSGTNGLGATTITSTMQKSSFAGVKVEQTVPHLPPPQPRTSHYADFQPPAAEKPITAMMAVEPSSLVSAFHMYESHDHLCLGQTIDTSSAVPGTALEKYDIGSSCKVAGIMKVDRGANGMRRYMKLFLVAQRPEEVDEDEAEGGVPL